jgi:hypothetical protein
MREMGRSLSLNCASRDVGIDASLVCPPDTAVACSFQNGFGSHLQSAEIGHASYFPEGLYLSAWFIWNARPSSLSGGELVGCSILISSWCLNLGRCEMEDGEEKWVEEGN